MLKPKRPRQNRRQQQQVQNPISDMEQFYLNQYFRSTPSMYGPGPAMHPFAKTSSERIPSIEFTKTHEIEMRLARVEQMLGIYS